MGHWKLLLLLYVTAAVSVSLDKQPEKLYRPRIEKASGSVSEQPRVPQAASPDRGQFEVSQDALDNLHHVLNTPYHPEKRFAQIRTSASASQRATTAAEQQAGDGPNIVPSWTLPKNPYTAYPFGPFFPRPEDHRFVYPYYSHWPEYLHEYYPRQYNPYFYYRGQYYPAYDYRFYDPFAPTALNPRPQFAPWQRPATDSVNVGQNPPSDFPQFRSSSASPSATASAAERQAQEADAEFKRAEAALRASEATLGGDAQANLLETKAEKADATASKNEGQGQGEGAEQDPVTLATAHIKANAISFDDDDFNFGGSGRIVGNGPYRQPALTEPFPYVREGPVLNERGQPNPWSMWYAQQASAAQAQAQAQAAAAQQSTSTYTSPDGREQVIEFVQPGALGSDGSVSSVAGKVVTRTLSDDPRVTSASVDVKASVVSDGQGPGQDTVTFTSGSALPLGRRRRAIIRSARDRDASGFVPAFNQRAFDAWQPDFAPVGEYERHAAAAAALQSLFGPPPDELAGIVAPADFVAAGRAHLIRRGDSVFWTPEFQDVCCVVTDTPVRVVKPGKLKTKKKKSEEYQGDVDYMGTEYIGDLGEYTGDAEMEQIAKYWARQAALNDDAEIVMELDHPRIQRVPVPIPIYRKRIRVPVPEPTLVFPLPVDDFEPDFQPEIVDDEPSWDSEPAYVAPGTLGSDDLSFAPTPTFPAGNSEIIDVPGATIVRGRPVPTGIPSNEARIHFVKPKKSSGDGGKKKQTRQ